MKILRICYPEVENFVQRENGKFTGFLTNLLSYMERAFNRVNHSFVGEDSFGTLVDRHRLVYDGCLGSMQRNDSDLGLMWINVPVPGPNLTQTLVLGSDQPVITATYHKMPDQLHNTHVLDMFAAISPLVWILVVLCYSMTSAVMVMSVVVARNSCHSLKKWRQLRRDCSKPVLQLIFLMLSCGLAQHSCSSSSKLLRIRRVLLLYGLLAVFGFFIKFFATSMIKTEMVTLKKPNVIGSYSDLLANKSVRPVWIKQIDDYQEFRDAPLGSQEQEIWQRAVDMGLDESLVSIENGIETAKNVATKVADGAYVLITSRLVTGVASPNACSFSRTWNFRPEANAYNHRNPNGRQRLRGLVQNSNGPQDELLFARKRLTRFFEFAIMDMSLFELRFAIMPPAKDKMRAIEECLLNKIVYPDIVLSTPDMDHFTGLFVLLVAFLTLTSIAWCFEQTREFFVRKTRVHVLPQATIPAIRLTPVSTT